MSYMRQWETGVRESLAKLLDVDPASKELEDFFIHLSIWVDARAAEAVHPDD